MKLKLILCLALVLSGGLFGCFTNSRLQNTNYHSPIGNVEKEVERLKNWECNYPDNIDSFYSRQTNSPLINLINLAKDGDSEGISGIFRLIPYLTNTSPTKSSVVINPHISLARRPVLLNEYIAYIITRAADHQFYIASGDSVVLQLEDQLRDPLIIQWFQFQIEHWCSTHINSSLKRRKIADINDWFHYNRFAAYAWFAKTKSSDGRLPLERRIDYFLNTDSLDSLTESELAACAEALAAIGDRQSLPAVKKVCDYIWNYPSHGSWEVNNLFQAYHALAALGDKQKALAELKQYSDKYLNKMELSTQQEFENALKEAQKW